MNIKASPHAGVRGPADHSIRDQILLAADEHFSYYGYGKTTVSDLAKAIGFSKAYIYKFFDSKQAIGEAICHKCLSSLLDKVREALGEGSAAADGLRILFTTIAAGSTDLFFSDRRLYDIVIYSTGEKWPSSQEYERQVRELLKNILRQGRETGEFETRTPLDDQCRSIFLAMESFVNPLLLQHKLDGIPAAIDDLIKLVLRSLTP
ncbi:TetR/AcrR family transcriptional regulator [Sodalis ligni]|uniref:TetR family transcriptional regulator n=1 Tax=Sodalis ligni TaxID=2697027 RepID=A0A4R1NNW3_9GAMM|nr:TetR/AcrR family transcriptional regulator [Sodalis ligni]TCL06040.1 TetR family transcriptional regulator [Sodalis ligni]